MYNKPPSPDVHENFSMAGCLAVPLPSLLMLLLLLVLVPAAYGKCGPYVNITVSAPQKIDYVFTDGGTCFWRFQSADASDRLRIFDVTMTREQNANLSCILVQNGEERLANATLGITCARLNSSLDLVSAEDLLLVLFLAYPGDRAQFTVQNFSGDAMPGCNEEVQLGTSGEMFLESPNHPLPYPGGLTCWWRLRAPPGFRVHLKSLTFDLTSSDGSFLHGFFLRDTLTVYDGEDAAARNRKIFSWTSGIRGLRSSGPVLYLHFNSYDTGNKGRGFRLSLHVQEENFPGVNREILVPSSTNLTLTSPNFPEDYPSNFECWWLLRAPPGETFILSTLTFDVPCSSRGSDRLIIYDGDDASAPVLRSACGTRYSARGVKSNSSSLFVHFKSAFDDEVGKGFHMVFHADKHENLAGVNREIFVPNSTYQFLKSPNFPWNYPTNFECWWLLRAPPGVTLKLSALTFDVPCQLGFDTVVIYDGNTTSAPVLKRTCGKRSYLRVESTGSSLYILFKSGSIAGKGLHMEFRAVTDTYECRSTEETIDIEGIGVMYLISPRYPLNYNSTDGCLARFQATLYDHVVKVEAVELEMPGSESNCGSDSLDVFTGFYNTGQRIAQWCGSSLPSPAFSRSSGIKFVLSRNQRTSHPGGKFKLRLEQVPSDSAPSPSSGRLDSMTIGIIVSSTVCPAAIIGLTVFVVCAHKYRARKRWPHRRATVNTVHYTNREPPSSASRTSGASAPVQEREGGAAQGFHPPVGSRAAYDGMGPGYLGSLYPPYQGVDPPPPPPVAVAPFKGDNSTEGTPEAPPPSYRDVMANTTMYKPEADK